MNTASPDTPNKPKTGWQSFLEFCTLPAPSIAELPLCLFGVFNHWLEKAFDWFLEGPISEWMSDMKHYHPKVYWSTAIIWIPLLLVVGFYVLDLLFICGISAVVFVICITVAFTVICKVIYFINIISHQFKRIRRKTATDINSKSITDSIASKENLVDSNTAVVELKPQSKLSKRTKRFIYWIVGIIIFILNIPFVIFAIDKLVDRFILYNYF